VYWGEKSLEYTLRDCQFKIFVFKQSKQERIPERSVTEDTIVLLVVAESEGQNVIQSISLSRVVGFQGKKTVGQSLGTVDLLCVIGSIIQMQRTNK
jgi:hypothetical protein